MNIEVTGQGRQAGLQVQSKDSTSVDTNMEVQNKNEIDVNKDTKDEVDKKELDKSINKLNKFLEDEKTHAEYSYHDKFKNILMIKIVDDETDKVIMEVPPKKILDMVAKMCELAGVLIDKKA